MDRPTERHLRCPQCSVPRFLAGVCGSVAGTLRVPCTKCRRTTIFDLATAQPITSLIEVGRERELRCGACRWFLSGVTIDGGAGVVRVPCVRRGCKRNNAFAVSDRDTPVDVQVPVA